MLDSNLIIYAVRPEFPGLRRLIAARSPAVSAVSVVEVPGYHKLAPTDRIHFEAFFAAAEVLPLSDAVVATTALAFRRELLTRNTRDFAGVSGLVAVDPLADGDPA